MDDTTSVYALQTGQQLLGQAHNGHTVSVDVQAQRVKPLEHQGHGPGVQELNYLNAWRALAAGKMSLQHGSEPGAPACSLAQSRRKRASFAICDSSELCFTATSMAPCLDTCSYCSCRYRHERETGSGKGVSVWTQRHHRCCWFEMNRPSLQV